MEVLLTIALVGMALAPAYMMQSTTMRQVYKFSEQLRLLFPMKNFWTETTRKTLESKKQDDAKDPSSPSASSDTVVKKITRPSGTVTYKMRPVGENSALKKIKGMQKVQVTGKTTRGQQGTLVGFVYKPEQEKK